jgi:hypothetical protein
MGDEISIPMSLPLDSDGFLRRECPTCEREFKWLPTQSEGSGAPAPIGGYFCPYCGVQALANAWWTKAQLQLAKAKAYKEVIQPEMDKFERIVEGLNTSAGLVSISASMERGEIVDVPHLVEVGDMRRVDFECHDEPVKILDDWNASVHCLLCGQPAA